MFIIFNYSKRQGLILSLILMLSSIIKFIELIWIQPSQANIAISMFFLVIQLLIVLVGFFAKIYREENTMTRVLNNELIQTNKQLIRYSDEIKQLTKVEERANIARDLHDTLGHEMTGLIMQMEMVSRMLQNNKVDDGLKILEDAKKSARGSLSKVRQIVNTLKNDAEIEWTKNSLYSLINDFSKKTNTLIEFNMNGEKNIKPEVGIALYRSIQESLTNAIRHGEASKIEVIINYLENKVTFNIRDNGKGCKNIIKGNGLMGMTERIDFLKGEISFNNLENGFSVKGLIPYEREEIG
jgi:signal transduction histidine kinase